MKKHSQLVPAALIICTLVLNGNVSAIGNRTAHGGLQAHEGDAPTSALEARDLPIEQYLKLKRTALLNAVAQPEPRIRNPRVSATGLDPLVSAILDEEQRYLRESDHARTVHLRGSSQLRRGVLIPVSLASPCPDPLIAAVNGRAIGAVFTPQLGRNHYRIEGCGFGNVRGEVRLVPDSNVMPAAAAIAPVTLLPENLSAWSDREIDVRLDPRLAGLPDSSAMLVVRLADGRQVEFSHCRFVAVRGEPVALKTVPASWVKLNATGGTRPIPQLEYVSPPSGEAEMPLSAAKISTLILRSDSDSFDGGSDTYDFSGLNPGWAVESVQIQKYSVACQGDVTRTRNFGEWKTTFNESAFTVRWASTTCSSFIPPTFRFTLASSVYAMTVWVIGPIGTEPNANAKREHEQN